MGCLGGMGWEFTLPGAEVGSLEAPNAMIAFDPQSTVILYTWLVGWLTVITRPLALHSGTTSSLSQIFPWYLCSLTDWSTHIKVVPPIVCLHGADFEDMVFVDGFVVLVHQITTLNAVLDTDTICNNISMIIIKQITTLNAVSNHIKMFKLLLF